MKFIAIVGTNASFSYNRKLLWYMKKHFTKEAQIEIVEITDLPLFSEDIREIPEGVQKIAEAIREADGLIFSTPEYDHAITAALKSLIEWLSWIKPQPLNSLPVMIVGVSLGNMGTVFAQENLRQILSSPGLDAFVLPSNQFLLGRAAEAFNQQDELIDERTISWLEHCFNNFMIYSKTLKPMRFPSPKKENNKEIIESEESKNSTETEEVWWTKETNQGLPVLSDADTGASEATMHDDRAYVLAMLGWYLSEKRMEHIRKKKRTQSPSDITKLFSVRAPKKVTRF